MNLEYPKVIRLESCTDLEVKPYLLLEEEEYIFEKLKYIDNLMEREYNLDCLLLQIACGIKESLDYDLLKANGVFEEIRFILADYIKEINQSLEFEFSIERSMKEFLSDMSKLADKAIKKIPNQSKIEKIINTITDKVPNNITK